MPKELEVWTIPPIRKHKYSPSLDMEAKFAAQPYFLNKVHNFL